MYLDNNIDWIYLITEHIFHKIPQIAWHFAKSIVLLLCGYAEQSSTITYVDTT